MKRPKSKYIGGYRPPKCWICDEEQDPLTNPATEVIPGRVIFRRLQAFTRQEVKMHVESEHDMSLAEYQEQYPEARIYPEAKKDE